jgi:hypothetical protein
MKRTITFSMVILVASLFVGRALKVHAATTPASPAGSAVHSSSDAAEDDGYWAAWSNAVAH